MKFFSRKNREARRARYEARKRRYEAVYPPERMYADHSASVAMFVATQPGYVAPTEDEQVREAEAHLDESAVKEAEQPTSTDTRDSGVFETPSTPDGPGAFESSSSSDSYSSSYDSGSSYSSSYDSGSSYSSYDSGSSSSYDSGSSYSGGDSGGSW